MEKLSDIKQGSLVLWGLCNFNQGVPSPGEIDVVIHDLDVVIPCNIAGVNQLCLLLSPNQLTRTGFT